MPVLPRPVGSSVWLLRYLDDVRVGFERGDDRLLDTEPYAVGGVEAARRELNARQIKVVDPGIAQSSALA